MTIVNVDSQICLWEYQTEENHLYTGMTNEYNLTNTYKYGYGLRSPLQEVFEGAEA